MNYDYTEELKYQTPVEPERLQVRVIKVQGKSSLVQWIEGDDVRRAIVPTGEIKEGMIDRFVLEAGIPYGLPWEEIIHLTASSENVARELRRAGLWTGDDVMKNTSAAMGALQTALKTDFAAILRAAKAYQEESR